MDVREMKSEELIEKLTSLWKTRETKQLAKIFKDYMESIGAKKWNSKRKDNLNTYLIDGKSTDWNRATCYYYKECANYADENISMVLRKRGGSYLIIAKRGIRAFEVDYHRVLHYEEELLKDIIEEHKPLFASLLAMEDKA